MQAFFGKVLNIFGSDFLHFDFFTYTRYKKPFFSITFIDSFTELATVKR